MRNTNHLDSFHTLLSKSTLKSFFSIWKQNSGGCRQQIIFVTLETVACGYISTGISHERQRFLWDVFVLCVLVYFYAFWTSHKNQLAMRMCFFSAGCYVGGPSVNPGTLLYSPTGQRSVSKRVSRQHTPLIWDQGVHVLVSTQKSRVNDHALKTNNLYNLTNLKQDFGLVVSFSFVLFLLEM